MQRRHIKKRFPKKRRGTKRYAPPDFTKRTGKGKVPRLFPLAVKTFKQSYYPTASTMVTNGNCTYSAVSAGLAGPSTTASGDGFFTLVASMSDLGNNSAYSALFDQYRIEKWKVDFIPANCSQMTQSGASGSNPTGFSERIETVIDRDDNALLTNAAAILEYDNYMTSPPWETHTRGPFTPNCQLGMLRTGSITAIGFNNNFPYENNWIDVAYTDVQHFALKGRIPSANTAANNVQASWYVVCTMWISFRNTR